jgi:hypothetical protein
VATRLALAFVLVAAALAVTAGLAQAGGPPFVVQGDHSVGGLVMGRGTPAQARARFGAPSSTRKTAQDCTLTWSALGLKIAFLAFGGTPCTSGAAVQATITNRARWRTALGLRVGDTVARVAALYPKARVAGSERWLVTRHACLEVGGQAYGGLVARIHSGRVTALVVTAGVCE